MKLDPAPASAVACLGPTMKKILLIGYTVEKIRNITGTAYIRESLTG